MPDTQLFFHTVKGRHKGNWKSLGGLLLVYGLALCLLLSGLYLLKLHPVQVVNLKVMDVLIGLVPAGPESGRVITVDIDERSLKDFGQWPWPRHRIAALLDNLKELGADTIGITIIFPEQERNSLNTIQEMMGSDVDPTIDFSALAGTMRDPDVVLADTLKSGPFVLGYSFLFAADTVASADCPLQPVFLEETGYFPTIDYYRARGVVCNYRPLSESIRASGFHNGSPDQDGVLRRLPLLISYNDGLYPSFALAVLLQRHGKATVQFHHDVLGTTYLAVNGRHLPLDDHANLLLGSPTSGRPEKISATDVLRKNISQDDVAGKIVLVGTTAAGMSQSWSMPFDEELSLLDLWWLAIDDMLTGNVNVRTGAMPFMETAATMLLLVPVVLFIAVLTPFWSLFFCVILLLVVWVALFVVYRDTGYLFSPLLPTCAIVLLSGVLHVLRFRQMQHHASEDADRALGLLKTQEDTLHSILGTIPDIVFRLDQAGNITYISPAIARYLRDPGVLIGRSIFNMVVSEDRDKARYRLNERRTGDRATTNLELRLQLTREDDTAGTSRYFSISAEGLYLESTPDQKRFIGTQGIVRDITEKKQLERQLVQAQKMEVIGNLAAGIAHDLNNILSGLVSYPDLLIMELPEDSPLREKVAIIQRSGRKAAVIVQDLLALARRNIDVDSICNLNTIVSDYLVSVEFQRVRLRYPTISIRHELESGVLNCRGSAVHLSKVLMNAIHNALEAMPAGGEVVVSTRMIKLSQSHLGYESIPPGNYVLLQVHDEGVGVAPAELARIFEPFYTKKTMDRSGTGLGMTVIWGTVKDHNGYLDIISAEGVGTTLVVYLPATGELQQQPGRRIVLEDYIGSEALLIVDDDEDQRSITTTILAKLGYQVLSAASGEEGVDIVDKQEIQLVVLDMVMPGGMDGLDSFRVMKSIRPELKAVIISGFTENDRVQEVQRLGAGSFIQKPYSMEQLGMAIRAELDRPAGSAR